MSNGHACCLYGVCCPPNPDGTSPQAVALAKKMAVDLGWSSTEAILWVLKNFDLAPKGTTDALRGLYGPLFVEAEAKRAADLAGTDDPQGGAA